MHRHPPQLRTLLTIKVNTDSAATAVKAAEIRVAVEVVVAATVVVDEAIPAVAMPTPTTKAAPVIGT